MTFSQQSIDAISSAYSPTGAALELGVLMVDGQPHPDVPIKLSASMLNRHGLVAGATGTGKTKTLQLMAEQISKMGVPVFAADVKGDLSGIAIPGEASDKLKGRTDAIGQSWVPAGCPTEFYSLGGQGTGVPLRATVSSFGPLLLSKVLGLNQTQESTLGLVFQYADSHGLLLLDLKDLREVLMYLTSPEGKADLQGIGGVSSATVGVILRSITALEGQGGDVFFGEPEFETADLLRTTADGQGIISMLELPNVADRPALFSTFLMWLLAELYHDLPEVGDLDKPKLVFFFDEAHLLFESASKAFLDQVTQTIRLVRSKGVGVFFVTQMPTDVPDAILAQLGSRVQHALRAHTPNDATALKKTVKTYPTSEYDLEQLLTNLGIGEAVVTVMSETGAPTPVAWTRMLAPTSLMGPMNPDWMTQGVAQSSMNAKYGQAVDRESAYEVLSKKVSDAAAAEAAPAAKPAAAGKAQEGDSTLEQLGKNPIVRQVERTVVNQITRSVMGTILKSFK